MLVHKANRHVLHGGNGCEWVDPDLKLVTVGGNGLKNEWEWDKNE